MPVNNPTGDHFNPPSNLNGLVITSSRYVSPLAQVNGINGANNTSLRVQDFNWTISVVRNLDSSTPNANIANLGYFGVNQTIVTSGAAGVANTVQAQIVVETLDFAPSNNSSNPMPAARYSITLIGRDAGCDGVPLTNTCGQQLSYTFTADLRIVPVSVKEVEASWTPGNDPGGQGQGYFVQVQINTGTVLQNGYYIFPYNTLASLSSSMPTPGTISISEALRVTTSGANEFGNGAPTKTFFASTETAVRNLWASSGYVADPPTGGNVITYQPTTPNPAFTTYTYEIIP